MTPEINSKFDAIEHKFMSLTALCVAIIEEIEKVDGLGIKQGVSDRLEVAATRMRDIDKTDISSAIHELRELVSAAQPEPPSVASH